MSERQEGWYWVMVFEGTWEPAHFDGQYFTLDYGPVAKVGPRIPSPDESIERHDYAGVIVWVGALRVVRLLSETECRHEVVPGNSLTHAAQRCLDDLAEVIIHDRAPT